MSKTIKKEVMVSASNGYIPLSEIKKKGIWITESNCLACGRPHLVTANSFNSYICFSCRTTRKKKN